MARIHAFEIDDIKVISVQMELMDVLVQVRTIFICVTPNQMENHVFVIFDAFLDHLPFGTPKRYIILTCHLIVIDLSDLMFLLLYVRERETKMNLMML